VRTALPIGSAGLNHYADMLVVALATASESMLLYDFAFGSTSKFKGTIAFILK
jgi:hypothetical protein